jgi:hypothetical protein
MRAMKARVPGTGVLLGLAVAVLAGAPAHAETGPATLLTIDQYLLRADFAGEVLVRDQSWDLEAGLQRVRLEVVDPWFTRWRMGEEIALTTGLRMAAFQPGARYVVFVSGGPWEESPFTFRAESVFRVEQDGRVRCRSGNPLFGLLNDGFLCTAPELVVGEPVTVAEMRDQVLRAREKAARRLPALEQALSSRPLALERSPSAAARAQEVRR